MSHRQFYMTRIVMSLCLLLLAIDAHSAAINYVYRGWIDKSSQELLDMGNRYNNMLGQQDSAMVCYSIIAERCNANSSQQEKELAVRALNEMGVLNTICFNNHTEAYRNLQEAYDLSKSIGLSEMEPYILLNFGNLYNLYEFLFPSVSQSPKAGMYYEQSFRAACRTHEWDMAINSYINFVMLNMPYGVGEKAVHIEMSKWLSDSIPRSTSDWKFARHFLDGNMAMMRGDSKQALACYEMMWDDIVTSDSISPVREQYMVFLCLTAVHLQNKEYDTAIRYAHKILALEGQQDMTDVHVETYRLLSEYYSKLGDEKHANNYHIAYLENKELLMKNVVGLVPSELSHDLNELNAEMDKMQQHRRIQTICLVAAILVICLLGFFAWFMSQKNQALNEKNVALYKRINDIIQMDEERKQERNGDKYKDSVLKEEQKLALSEKIRLAMDCTEDICQPTFTLAKLAEKLGSNTSYLSQTINEHFGMTFTSLLNQSRVKEACRRMEDKENYGHLTIDAISESVGFRARVTFTKAFKQYVGMLPSEYLKTRGHEKL